MKTIQPLITMLLLTISTAIFAQTEAKTITLEQTPGKFTTETLTLKPGNYVFEVANEGVDHEVAFFLQSEKDKESTEFSTALPNSGLSKVVKDGETAKSGIVELKKGTYVYSCPMNPTPKYTLIVQ